mgnify:CR=1 FL=1
MSAPSRKPPRTRLTIVTKPGRVRAARAPPSPAAASQTGPEPEHAEDERAVALPHRARNAATRRPEAQARQHIRSPTPDDHQARPKRRERRRSKRQKAQRRKRVGCADTRQLFWPNSREHPVERIERHAQEHPHAGINANARVSGSRQATNAPNANDTDAVATRTDSAVTPARASAPASGRRKAWKFGFSA